MSNGFLLAIEGSNLTGQHGFYMYGAHLNPGSTMYVRRSAFKASTPSYFTMYATGDGGQIDHDGTNRHSVGEVRVYFTAASWNSYFIVMNSDVSTVNYQQSSTAHVTQNVTIVALGSTMNHFYANPGSTSGSTIRATNSTVANIHWNAGTITLTELTVNNVSGITSTMTAITATNSQHSFLDSTMTTLISTSLTTASSGMLTVHNRTTAGYIYLYGTHTTGASYSIDQCTASTTNTYAMYNIATFTDAIFEIARSTLESSNLFVIAHVAHVRGASVHRYVDNYLINTFTGCATTSHWRCFSTRRCLR